MLKFSECSRLIWGQNGERIFFQSSRPHHRASHYRTFGNFRIGRGNNEMWQIELLTTEQKNSVEQNHKWFLLPSKSECFAETNHTAVYALAGYLRDRTTPRMIDKNGDPQTGVDQRRALICNLRSEYRCSMCPAIHTNSHSLLRPSSTSEPSDSPPRFFYLFFFSQVKLTSEWTLFSLSFIFFFQQKWKKGAKGS